MGTTLSLQQADMLASIIINVAFLAGATIGCLLIDRAGRRPLFMAGCGGVGAAFLAAAAVVVRLDSATIRQANSVSWAAGAVFALMFVRGLGFLFVGMGSATVFFVYVTETHSLATRAMGTGLCMALMLVMQGIASFATLPLLCWNPRTVNLVMGFAFMFLAVPFGHFFMIETTGMPLESIPDQWAAHWFWGAFFGRVMRTPPKPAARALLWCLGRRGARRAGGAGGRGGGGPEALAAGSTVADGSVTKQLGVEMQMSEVEQAVVAAAAGAAAAAACAAAAAGDAGSAAVAAESACVDFRAMASAAAASAAGAAAAGDAAAAAAAAAAATDFDATAAALEADFGVAAALGGAEGGCLEAGQAGHHELMTRHID
ncbi:hypothetical protein MNEG_5443 [Monoraphidium neglectum]|uniref:Major facilitator superfamily (MFS) profile domain-containing protein n=1 Tax=Monoraphidium neglectum TaxID=145388 RepID=A0A0D2MHG1_9CHLO|nr:hypothetical protein MNEG_5443 [Monoraphidium neglectum]KIZ02515.1 hypothetical protein MNEG_5443 [Monoraphidium neglectum]|eukprot:XP_013901534.1 hypothetical protein MNEG_5443 [Monoraphidium neglectum]